MGSLIDEIPGELLASDLVISALVPGSIQVSACRLRVRSMAGRGDSLAVVQVRLGRSGRGRVLYQEKVNLLDIASYGSALNRAVIWATSNVDRVYL